MPVTGLKRPDTGKDDDEGKNDNVSAVLHICEIWFVTL
jgi:hypothetical protein